jgi:hypothetical protein
MTPLEERSACHRDLYLTTHNTHNRQTSTLPVGFEPAIPASKRPDTHALDRAATGIGIQWYSPTQNVQGIKQGCAVGTQKLQLRLLDF